MGVRQNGFSSDSVFRFSHPILTGWPAAGAIADKSLPAGGRLALFPASSAVSSFVTDPDPLPASGTVPLPADG